MRLRETFGDSRDSRRLLDTHETLDTNKDSRGIMTHRDCRDLMRLLWTDETLDKHSDSRGLVTFQETIGDS